MAELKAWSWRKAMADSELPSTTKLLLHTLDLHMTGAGENCFPSFTLLQKETSLSRPAVWKHLRFAESQGWIQSVKRQRADGGNSMNLYEPRYPNGLGNEVNIDPPLGNEVSKSGNEVNQPSRTPLKDSNIISPPKDSPLLKAVGIEESYSVEFEELYQLSPRMGVKDAAYKRYKKTMESGEIAYPELRRRWKGYIENTEPAYAMYFRTYLAQGGWRDDTQPKPKDEMQVAMDELEDILMDGDDGK